MLGLMLVFIVPSGELRTLEGCGHCGINGIIAVLWGT